MGLLTPINTNIITSLINYLKNTVITINIATQAEAESAASGVLASIDNTKIITPKGWRYAWNKALTLAWTFISKITFTSGINVAAASIPASPIQGDIYYSNDGALGSGYYVSSEDYTNAKIITTFNQATELLKGIAEIATQAEVTTGTDDTRFVTPLKLKTNQFNTASVTAVIATPYAVTLNSIAGNIVIPAGIGCNIVSGTSQVITLNNNKLTTTSVIEYTVRGYGKSILQGGYNVTTNQAQISLFNADVSAVTQLDIYFKILNTL